MINWAERAKVAIGQKGQYLTAKTDETPVSRLLAVSSVGLGATLTLPERLSSVLTVPPPTVLEEHDSSTPLIDDPDRWCWPHSKAMNRAEIDLILARLRRFADKGLLASAGEALANKLLIRDRESDDRRVCLECSHLNGHGTRSWHCGNWQGAGVAHQAWDAQLAADLVVLLQRCSGFADIEWPNTLAESEVTP
jgi:hypothetical protein